VNTPEIQIKSHRGLVPLNLHELWEFRELAFFLFWRDLRGRYRQMALGPLWMIINPLINVVIYSVLFGMMAKFPSDGLPYPLFTYSALLPWTFFVAAYGAAAESLLRHKDLIAKVYFPRMIVPGIGILSALVDFLISLIMLLILMFWFDFLPTWNLLVIPLFLLPAAVFGLAIGLWVAPWIVHFRDLSNVMGYVLRLWMYATPVVYASSFVPEKWQPVYQLNPMTPVIDGFRWAVLGTGAPSLERIGWSLLVMVPLLIGGAYYYRKAERDIVDIA
jgi:lipopolysaccharide transport system permease protein